MKLSEEQKERRELILEIVENQIRERNPPETQKTLQRLMSEGYTSSEAREFIAAVLVTEIFTMLKNQEVFDKERFVAALCKLPDLPY